MKIKEITPINESKVYLDTVRLFKHIMLIAEKMPKMYRHLLGEPMVNQIVGMIDSITAATITRDNVKRLEHLDNFMTKLGVLSALITGLAEIKQISLKHEAIFTEFSEEIGKQVNSWRSKTAAKIS